MSLTVAVGDVMHQGPSTVLNGYYYWVLGIWYFGTYLFVNLKRRGPSGLHTGKE